MPKKKEKELDVIENTEDIEPELKEKKSDRFFAHLHDIEKDFRITVYQHGERGKKIEMAKFENTVPDELTDIRDEFGDGTYSLYCHEVSDGRVIGLLDFCIVHLAGSKKEHSLPIQGSSNNIREILELVAGLKAAIGGNEQGGISDVIKMQADMTLNQNKMMLEMSTKLMQMQVDAEKRFTNMLEKMSDKKDAVENILKTVELIETLKGAGSDNQPIWEKLLNSPVAEPLIKSLLSNDNQGQGLIQGNQVNYTPPPQKELTSEEKINIILGKIPDSVKEQISEDNKDDVTKRLFEKNSSLLNLEETKELVSLIIINNAVKQTEVEQ